MMKRVLIRQKEEGFDVRTYCGEVGKRHPFTTPSPFCLPNFLSPPQKIHPFYDLILLFIFSTVSLKVGSCAIFVSTFLME
jgi:hypothetical protein